MTKLVIVLAVVVVVILVVVFVAVRNMRAEDPEEFADRPHGRGGNRGGRDERDLRYDRREPAERQPARASRGGRPAGRPGADGHRPAAARGYDEDRDQPGDGYDQRRQNGRGHDEDRGFDQRRGRDGRRGAPRPPGSEERRRGGKAAPPRPEESQARSRQARARRSDDSSQWDSSEWEKLSDIDYWTELASDKPLATTAQPAAQARPERPRADREAETAAIRAPRSAEAGPGGAVPAVPVVPGGVPRRDPVTGLPVRGGPQAGPELVAAAGARADFASAPVPAAVAEDQLRPLAEPRLPPPKHADPSGLPGPARGLAPNRPLVDPDDDPLTSPSFPRIPASDSRSYHNGRTSTPAWGSRAPARELEPTQQFTSYGSPAPPPAAARHAVPADVGGDTDRTNPNSYLPDPLLNGDPYPVPNGNPYPAPDGNHHPVPDGDPYPVRAATAPAAPAPSAPAASGNPYGSYVTSDSQDTAFSYGDYPDLPGGNGHGPYLPSPVPGGTSTGRHSGSNYWQHQQPTAPAGVLGAGASGYPDAPAQAPDPRDSGAQAAGYRNGYGQHDQPGYLPNGYPAGSHNPAGYGLQDPYGHDGYGGYPEYGAAEN